MSEHASHDHPSADHAPSFTDNEWAGFRADDFSAGKAVVILMLAIFLTGVFIYSVVAYWVLAFSG
jgi:hypothetical protein